MKLFLKEPERIRIYLNKTKRLSTTGTRRGQENFNCLSHVRVILMSSSSIPIKSFSLAPVEKASQIPSAASLTMRSSFLESVLECFFKRPLSQLPQITSLALPTEEAHASDRPAAHDVLFFRSLENIVLI